MQQQIILFGGPPWVLLPMLRWGRRGAPAGGPHACCSAMLVGGPPGGGPNPNPRGSRAGGPHGRSSSRRRGPRSLRGNEVVGLL